MNSLGPAKAAILIDLQLIIAYVIELLGWFGVENLTAYHTKLGMAITISICIFEK